MFETRSHATARKNSRLVSAFTLSFRAKCERRASCVLRWKTTGDEHPNITRSDGMDGPSATRVVTSAELSPAALNIIKEGGPVRV